MRYTGLVSLGVGIGTAIGGLASLASGDISGVSKLLTGSLFIGFGAVMISASRIGREVSR